MIALSGDVDSWNPYVTQDTTSSGILDLLYPRLVREVGDPDGETRFEPWLAERWDRSDDGRSWTFRLRDALWSDGTPIDCEDVRFTFEAQQSDALAWSGAFLKQRIVSVECPSPRVAVFRFSESYPDQLIDANDDAIVPAAYGEIPLDAWASTRWEERYVGCGPFRLAEVRPGQEAILERNPDWWDVGAVDPGKVIFRVYADAAASLAALREGEIDLVGKVEPLAAQTFDEDVDGPRVIDLPSLSYTFIVWNVLRPDAYAEDRERRGCSAEHACDESVEDLERLRARDAHPILADARVRRALTQGIDRQDLIDGLLLGRGRVGSSPIVSSLWAHDPSARLPFDPSEASRLLDAAGWRDLDGDGVRERDGQPLELEVLVSASNAVRRDALERAAASLRRLGVDLRPTPLQRADFASRARSKRFDGLVAGWWAGTRVEPQHLLHSRSALDRGNNFGAWFTPESDALMERAARASDRSRAEPLWRTWQALFAEEQPMTVLYEERRLLGIGPRISGPTPSFLNPWGSVYQLRPQPAGEAGTR